VHQRIVHLLELLVAERPGEVDAEDLRADHRSELAHLEGLVAHRFFLLAFSPSVREKKGMSDTLVLRAGTPADAPAIAATIAAAFEQYRGKLVPESGAFAETADHIVGQLSSGSGAIVAERN